MLKAGTYFIGDLTYVVKDWGMFFQYGFFDTGEFSLANGAMGCFFKGRYSADFYSDNLGGTHPINMNSIGCIRTKSPGLMKNKFDHGIVVRFTKNFNCYNGGNFFLFGDILMKAERSRFKEWEDYEYSYEDFYEDFFNDNDTEEVLDDKIFMYNYIDLYPDYGCREYEYARWRMMRFGENADLCIMW